MAAAQALFLVQQPLDMVAETGLEPATSGL